ncbi:MAG: redoxin domain-containing protein [Planctomycetes bacterium]|nr:redoxin domain-containing protein [Planctomycetota bacterium]MBL7144534.1 redoxin domain-containing protein [Phycisphaerae bacterium]
MPSICVILCLLLVQITASAAQITSYNDTIIPIPHPITSLLWSETVHRELGFSAAQINEVENVVSESDLPLWRLRDLPPQKRNEAAAPLINQLNSKLAQILSDRQLERLDQLVWQARGIDVILGPQVTLRLNLSSEQTGRIRTLLNISYGKITSLKNNVDISSESQRAAYIQNLQAETQRNILAVLNSYQKNTFTMLMGRPFNFSRVQTVACKAPEFEIDTWINSPPVRLSELKGKVTVIHFYAFGCSNCIRTLPYYNDWHKKFPTSSFSIIGIHRPETEQERNIEKVEDKATRARIEYPIAIDNDSLAWNSWANNIWPSIYLIDKNGFVRYWWYGELNWQGAESEKLLAERIRELILELVAAPDTPMN